MGFRESRARKGMVSERVSEGREEAGMVGGARRRGEEKEQGGEREGELCNLGRERERG